jgi:hypothetical protein
MMTYSVAPGADGYNLLSKRHLFRVVLTMSGVADPKEPVCGPFVVEAKDGSYRFEIAMEDALEDGDLLVFDVYLKHRDKEYVCYFTDQEKGRFTWSLVPRKLVRLSDNEKREGGA